MSYLSQTHPHLGAPSRVKRYYAGSPDGEGSGIHSFLAGARWCRVTMVGGGGKGGDTGYWDSGSNYYYEAGGGGGAGETVIFEFDPTYYGASTEFIVGAAQSDSIFMGVVAHKGANGLTGEYETVGDYSFSGGLGGGLQAFGSNDSDTQKPTAPMYPCSIPGTSGGDPDSTTGDGGDSMYGQGGAAGGYVAGTTSPLSACPSGSVGSGFGAGGGGGGSSASHSGSLGLRTLGTGADGTGGIIIVEEWIY